MLKDYMELFRILERCQRPDTVGGTEENWTEGTVFCGGLQDAEGQAWQNGGLPALRTKLVLLHESGVTLALHQRVMRVRDGMVFRVLGCSDDQRTPGCAETAYACVNVEKVVNAP